MAGREGVRSSARLSGGSGAAAGPAPVDCEEQRRAAAALRRERAARAAERAREVEDSPQELRDKCRRLARALRDAKHLVVYTGAGISTAADIPDYRGPRGVWTRLRRGERVARVEVAAARPTFTHMALSALWARGALKFVVSQNCDGLHLRAGLPRRALAELHGDMFAERCGACRRVLLRAFDTTPRTARHAHGTRRLCACGAELQDSIVHFGERGRAAWPLNWAGALRHAAAADVVLCLGSSLKVLRRYPRLWRMRSAPAQRPALYIVNLQWTPKDAVAALKINARCDDVMAQVARRLRLRVPRYDPRADPLLAHAEPLAPPEVHTAPPHAPPPAPAALAATPPPLDYYSLSSPSASDSDDELPLCRLAERLRPPAPALHSFQVAMQTGETTILLRARHVPPEPPPLELAPRPSLSEPPPLALTPRPAPPEPPPLKLNPHPAPLEPPPLNVVPRPTPPEPPPLENTSRFTSPKLQPKEVIVRNAFSEPQTLEIMARNMPPKPPLLEITSRLASPKAPPQEVMVVARNMPPKPQPLEVIARPAPTGLKLPTRPVPALLKVLPRSTPPEPRPLKLASPLPPPVDAVPPLPPPAGSTGALRRFRMVRPQPFNGVTLTNGHHPLEREIKSESPPPVKIKKEKEEEEYKNGSVSPNGWSLGSQLRRLLELQPRLAPTAPPPRDCDDASAALAAAIIQRAVLLCRAHLYPGLHTIIPPAASAAPAPMKLLPATPPLIKQEKDAECAWCLRRYATKKCLWYGPPLRTPLERRVWRRERGRRYLCACCGEHGEEPGGENGVDGGGIEGGGWYGKGYRKGRRKRR